MAKKSLTNLLHKPTYLIFAILLVGFVGIGGIIVLASRNNQIPTPTPQQHQTQHARTNTPTRSPAPATHATITIPPADWLRNSYQYYDSNLDASITVPNGWGIVNDPSTAGEAMPGQTPQPIGKWCSSDLKNFFKDFSQCPTTLPYALKITPKNESPNRSYLVLMGVSNGLGGSCNAAIDSGSMKLYDAHITINNHPSIVTTGVTTRAYAGFQKAGIYQDCYYWPRVTETGQKSVWAMFNVRHWATDDATFITEMQILENIKFH